MATSATLKAPEAQPLWQKVAVVIPGLAIFGTFTASSVAMKIAPYFSLLPGGMNKDLMSAWKKFADVKEMQLVLKPLALDYKKFMLIVAAVHLIVALLLVLPSGPWGTRFAGLWAMVAMLGAEFCTRKTKHVPAGFGKDGPFKEYEQLGVLITSATHIILFLCGAYLVFSKHKGGLVAMLNEMLASMKKNYAQKEKTEDRGRSAQPPADKKSKRDSTPKPTVKKAGDSSSQGSPRSPPSSRGRGGKSK